MKIKRVTIIPWHLEKYTCRERGKIRVKIISEIIRVMIISEIMRPRTATAPEGKWLLVCVSQQLMRMKQTVDQWVIRTGLCRHQLISINLLARSDQSRCNWCSEPVIDWATCTWYSVHRHFKASKSKLRHLIRNGGFQILFLVLW